MKYKMTTPCDECPFQNSMARSVKRPGGFTLRNLILFAAGEFACHKACDVDEEGAFVARNDDTPHCAGALIFNEKRNCPHQMMRIAARLGLYDRSKLNMKASVR